ncbi:MAG: hypothetical protein WA690_16850 [Candidatus Acidiferrales bacterium]
MNWVSQNSDLVGLIVAAVAIVVTALIGWLHLRRKRTPFTATENGLNHSASSSEGLTPSVDPLPELTASTLSVDLNPTIQKNVLLLHVRNGATSPLATAKNVVANIGYKRKDGHAVWVDYGAWMERGTITNIEKDQTKNLVVALTDNGKNYAANWTGPRNKFIDPDLVPIGELTLGRWMMVVTINAENYERIFRFLLTIKPNGVIKCTPVQKSPW